MAGRSTESGAALQMLERAFQPGTCSEEVGDMVILPSTIAASFHPDRLGAMGATQDVYSHPLSTMNTRKARQMRNNRRTRRFTRLLAVAVTILLAASRAPGTLAPGASQARAAVASGARVLSLNENGSLHLTSRRGFTLNEQGLASGTVRGAIYVHLSIVSSSRVTAELNIYPSGGSITARGSASYHKERINARFSGSISIERGTGSYAHARGSGLSFSGTIQRSNDAVTVHVAGRAVD
jgi:hypothetical protein